MRTNCFMYALRRLIAEKWKGYLVIRRSRWGPFPHFIYMRELPPGADIEQFVPSDPEPRAVPPAVFDGYVKKCDLEQCVRCGRDCVKQPLGEHDGPSTTSST